MYIYCIFMILKVCLNMLILFNIMCSTKIIVSITFYRLQKIFAISELADIIIYNLNVYMLFIGQI